MLLDEPLANLDVHLRASMEREFARFHERTGTTMIYITHDQAEAMALADRIAVMDKGRILQVATPSQLYREPADETVARFIGEGMIVPVENVVGRRRWLLSRRSFRPSRARCATQPDRHLPTRPARACGRARCASSTSKTAGVRARVTGIIYQGGHFRVEAQPEAAVDAAAASCRRRALPARAGRRRQHRRRRRLDHPRHRHADATARPGLM